MGKMMLRLALWGLLAAAALQSASVAIAQSFPTRPITMIVPFAVGGPSDVVGRILSEHVQAALGQPLVIENVGGAGGSIGMGRVAHAAPDGYTLGLGSWSTGVVNGAIFPRLSYDVVDDFEPVILLPDTPLFITSKKALAAKTLSELVALVKASTDGMLVGTSGVGTSPHVAGAMLQQVTGAQVRLVHYRGGAPALQDLIAGHVDIIMNQSTAFLPLLGGDQIKILAVMAKTRLPQAPEIPTVDEAGLPGFYLSSWNGVWAPKRTPREVVQKLNAAIANALNDKVVRQRFSDLGQVVPPPDQLTVEAFREFQKAEVQKWWPIIKKAGIKAE